jgi:hypothetical protein
MVVKSHPPSIVGFQDRDYCYESVVTQISLVLGWHQFHTLTENSNGAPFSMSFKQFTLNLAANGMGYTFKYL